MAYVEIPGGSFSFCVAKKRPCFSLLRSPLWKRSAVRECATRNVCSWGLDKAVCCANQ